jgi:hypothetical protein
MALKSRTVVREVGAMKIMLIAALTLAAAIMTARAFSELPNGTTTDGKGIAHGTDASPRLLLQWQFVDDGY